MKRKLTAAEEKAYRDLARAAQKLRRAQSDALNERQQNRREVANA